MKSREPLRLTLTERFRKSVLELGPEAREKLKKQIGLLAADPRHPSLRVKKIKGTASIFEARVDESIRLTFEFGQKRQLILRVVGPHNAALKNPDLTSGRAGRAPRGACVSSGAGSLRHSREA
jgi:mRNA interferase RelE/StbE